MNKQEIINKLLTNHQNFVEFATNLSDDDFTISNNGKWTAGQQLDHIYRGVKPLTQGFMLPKFVFGLLFGKAEKDSLNYDDLVKKYQTILANGGKASGKFIPKTIEISEMEKLKNNLLKSVESLTKRLEKFSENELDKYRLPHPLLGKLTVREMLYFTIYHVEHHHKAALKNLEVN
ncbi:MAG: DinB family protein [Pyrinomonadaceae bacterium]|nr:DinB family protein [Pyrinomonadaceae bacterium]